MTYRFNGAPPNLWGNGNGNGSGDGDGAGDASGQGAGDGMDYGDMNGNSSEVSWKTPLFDRDFPPHAFVLFRASCFAGLCLEHILFGGCHER